MTLPTPPAPRVLGPLTLTDFVRYQGASGDMNPSHHDHEFARSNGSPGAFAPGLLSAGIMADWATSWLGARNVRGFGVRFAHPIYVGDILTVDGSLVEETSTDELVRIQLTCTRQDGAIATTGWATFETATAKTAVPS